MSREGDEDRNRGFFFVASHSLSLTNVILQREVGRQVLVIGNTEEGFS